MILSKFQNFPSEKTLLFDFEKPANCGSYSSTNNTNTLINYGSNYMLLLLLLRKHIPGIPGEGFFFFASKWKEFLISINTA